MLISRGYGAGELIDAAKLAYIQAAVNEVTPSGGRVNISRLSVITGLTRKEVSALLRRQESESRGLKPKKSTQQRALRVLHGWNVDPAFLKPNGRPADLPLQGEHKSFPHLVKRHSGDATPAAVLNELERMSAVRVTKVGKVRLRRQSIDSSNHRVQQMAEFFRLFKDFANTVQQTHGHKDPPLFFGFKDEYVDSPHQAALFQRTFARRAATLLESIDQWISHQGKERKAKKPAAKTKTRVGLGIYLVQE